MYSSDLVPSDYYLFRSLQNSLNEVNLISKEAMKITCFNFMPEISEILHRWNSSTRKITKGHRSKRHIFGLIKDL